MVQIVMWLFEESIHLKLVYSVGDTFHDLIKVKLNHFRATFNHFLDQTAQNDRLTLY